MALFLSGALSILIIDVIGHARVQVDTNGNNSLCMFAFHFDHESFSLQIPRLEMHWASLIPVNLLLGIGPVIVFTTTLEFIAAQSPHSMKGLLVGLMFTINGLFSLLSSLALLPFSLKDIWQSEHMKEHPPVTNCGFGYFLSTCVVATIGFILFMLVSKRYKYRERDDRPFDHRFADEFYEQVINNREQEDGSVSGE